MILASVSPSTRYLAATSISTPPFYAKRPSKSKIMPNRLPSDAMISPESRNMTGLTLSPPGGVSPLRKLISSSLLSVRNLSWLRCSSLRWPDSQMARCWSMHAIANN